MSHVLTESDTFTSTVSVTDINDTTYPTVEAAMGQALADRTRWLYRGLTGTTGTEELLEWDDFSAAVSALTIPATGRAGIVRDMAVVFAQWNRWLRERTIGAGSSPSVIMRPAIIANGDAEGGGFWDHRSPAASGLYDPYALQLVAGTREVQLMLPDMQPGLVIKSIVLNVQSPVSHSGSLPLTMPLVTLGRFSSSASITTIGSQADTSANTTAYEAEHTITLTLSETVLSGYAYILSVRGEASTNAQDASFRIYSVATSLWYE